MTHIMGAANGRFTYEMIGFHIHSTAAFASPTITQVVPTRSFTSGFAYRTRSLPCRLDSRRINFFDLSVGLYMDWTKLHGFCIS